MTFFDSFWGIVSAFVIFVVGAFLSIALGNKFYCTPKRAVTIYLWHTLFCFIYLAYVLNSHGDAISYYERAVPLGVEFKPGTIAVHMFTQWLKTTLDLSLLGTFLFFNFFGVVGLLAFDAALRLAISNKSLRIKRLANIIVFLPSISFWTSAIGKDSPVFLAVGLAIWSAFDIKKRFILMGLAVSIMLLIRPHIASLMIVSLLASLALSSKMPVLLRVVLICLTFAAAAKIVPYAMDFTGIGVESSFDEIDAYIDKRALYNRTGGGAVDISSMSLPAQVLTYVFRPLYIDASSIFQLAASIDNTILLFLFYSGMPGLLMRKKSDIDINRWFLWIYSLGAWIMLAATTSNLGIAMRQKWMFVPMLILLLMSVIGKRRAVSLNVPPSIGPHQQWSRPLPR